MPKDHLRNGRRQAGQLQGQTTSRCCGERDQQSNSASFLCPHILPERLNLFGYTGSVPALDARPQASPNLVGCPIHPALGIGINVDENETFDCVRVGQLREDRKIRSSQECASFLQQSVYCGVPPFPVLQHIVTGCRLQLQHQLQLS